ncbi:large conductance mechanosensitive channel protein MscL [Virgibacillus sp. DJP39]|uniref:large conductance mechanosensitive channel protein MscL n=1 Tax=Virgibacillus sp. DJP39 TaxID=3409790 RepID=UPI003BB648B1
MFLWKEFKAFALKGSVLDLAIAVVVGAAFGNIVSSLVDNIITPLLGIMLNGIDLTNLMYKLGGAEVTYGIFIQSVLDFIIISFSIFISVKFLLKFQPLKKPEDKKALITDSKEALLIEIRDLIKKQDEKKK